MCKILIVEDEVNIASFIKRGLQECGYEVTAAYDGEEAWQLIKQERYDLFMLDIIMPKIDGLQLCRMIRQNLGYSIPILMVTALGTTDDIVSGLDAGADDYISKPFSFAELQARIRALLRRREGAKVNQVLQCGDLTLDQVSRRATRNGETIDLTVKEYRLLEYFMNNQGIALSRLQLLREVWDKNFDTNTNIVDVYVNYLRAKIDKNHDKKLIRTVVGLGYMMEG
ncbi:MAG: response regulator transcription factor [Parabacteroides sp.]|nr:response regulator transcription factor [Parabacteroides sp.]